MQKDDNEVFNCFLNNALFLENRRFKPNGAKGAHLIKNGDLAIELIVRPECNQKCEYCYIYKYGTKLYPLEERVSNDIILNNLDKLLNYVFNIRKIFIYRWELFAGDLFYDNLIFDIFDVFYKYIKPAYDLYTDYFTYEKMLFIIPCNCSFVLDEEKRLHFEQMIEKMEQVGCKIVLSYSGDGKFVTAYRERKELDDDYYDTMFTFLSKYNYLPHPMISPENIEYQIENVKWWNNIFRTYYPYIDEYAPYMLEVRNDGWTDEKIASYIKLLKFTINDFLTIHNDNKAELAKAALDKSKKQIYKYYGLTPFEIKESSKYSCSIQHLFHITLNNLSIVPCHRTSYPQFKIGHFVINDDTGEIESIEADNLTLGLLIYDFRMDTLPGCTNCLCKKYCLRGCLGSQYETNGELFAPIASVCRLMKAKIYYLIKTYFDLGIFDIALEQKYITAEQLSDFKESLQSMEDDKIFLKWVEGIINNADSI